MKHHRRLVTTALALIVICAAPTVEAGGSVGIHIGGGWFGVSIGFGDWGIYTTSWADPYWSLDYNAVLAGYGEWVWIDGLGRVWHPWVAASWRPYTYGRWVSTTCGWTWVSYEPWGYLPHHYGSWAYSAFGWVWVPGYSYSCGNVVWVRTGGYVGWYARPPRGWSHASHGFVHGYNRGFDDGWRQGYGSGYSDGWQDARYGTFVEWKDFGTDNVGRRAVSHRIASASRVDTSGGAPTGDEVRRHGGPGMTETRLERRTVTVDGRNVTIARPVGVTESVERNAAETVSRALSGRAFEQRQPLVKPYAENQVAATNSSRSREVLPETRAPLRNDTAVARQTGVSPRDDRSAASSSPLHSRGTSTIGASRTVASAPSTRSRVEAQQPAAALRQSSSRRDAGFGAIESRGSRRTPAATSPVRSTVEPQKVQPPQRVITPQRSAGSAARAPAATARRPASSHTAASSRQNGARGDEANGPSSSRSSAVRRPAQRSSTGTR